MTLGNVRELGVRSLAATCERCHHHRCGRQIAGVAGTSSVNVLSAGFFSFDQELFDHRRVLAESHDGCWQAN